MVTMKATEPSDQKCGDERIDFSEPSVASLLRNLDLRSVEPVLWEAYSSRKRRPPYPPAAMLKAMIFQRIRQIGSSRKLASTLEHETAWLPVLGFKKAPCHQTFSEFTKRLGPERVRRLFLIVESRLRRTCPGLGERIALDSTIVRGYSNPNKRKGLVSDPDARWGVTGQKLNRPVHVFGYKLQISCDVDYELPLDYIVVPANRSDSRLYPEILLRTISSGNHVDVVIADAGYDSKKNILVTMKHHAKPIIKLNPRGSRDRRRRRADYLLPVRRNSDEWVRYYEKRTSVERVFSRLKEELGLNDVKLRSLERVEVHFGLCLITMLVIASTAAATGFPQLALCIEPWRYLG
jgi:hypothetical protein